MEKTNFSIEMGIHDEPWYKNGLRFQCTGCGKCCTGSPGYVWVTKEEMLSIAEFLDISIDLFVRKYVRQKDNRYSLIEKRHENFDCIFLKEKKCLIYEVRPLQCRTFPWWKNNLQSEESWKNAAQSCEGINNKAPIVPYDTIEKNEHSL
jgi:Fe-S-cluster containining protein